MDPYRVLGVPATAVTSEMRAAYRRLARQFHPDRQGGDSARMAEVNAAWRTLREETTRPREGSTPADRSDPVAVELDRDDGAYRRVLVLMIVASIVVMACVLIAVVLIGFGRVGVTVPK